MAKAKNKYKVEIKQTSTFIVDVLADTEEKARLDALRKFTDDIEPQGIAHYYQESETTSTTGTVFDVTHTDDPFNP